MARSSNSWKRAIDDFWALGTPTTKRRIQRYLSPQKIHRNELKGEYLSYCSMSHQHPSFAYLCRRDHDWRSFQALVKLVPGFKQYISKRGGPSRTLYYTNIRHLWLFNLTATHLFLPSSPLVLTPPEATIAPVSNQRSPSGSTHDRESPLNNVSLSQWGKDVVCNTIWLEDYCAR